jgi:hypothetical protein
MEVREILEARQKVKATAEKVSACHSEERSDEESLCFSVLKRREILRFACLPQAGSE